MEEKTQKIRKYRDPASIYPPRDGWDVNLTYRGEQMHIGYVTPKATLCPCCKKRLPVFEQSSSDTEENRQNGPAQLFIAICPRCELRADATGTLDECLDAWNNGRFTEDSVMVHRRMKDVDYTAMEKLSNAIVTDAVTQAVELVKQKNHLMAELKNPMMNDLVREIKYSHLSEVRGNLRKIQNFIDSSPLMLEHDPEAVLSTIRRHVYPDLTPDKRIEIPLKLVSM